MKTNCWLVLGTMLATSAVAQVNNAAGDSPAGHGRADAGRRGPHEYRGTRHQEKGRRPQKEESGQKDFRADGRAGRRPGHRNFPSISTCAARLGLKGEVIGHLKQGDTVK